MTVVDNLSVAIARTPQARRHSISNLLATLGKIAAQSPNLVAYHDASFNIDSEAYELPRYVFVGPKGGDIPIHIGIFAGLRGDKPEGSRAVIQFVKQLEANPELARGYCLSFYPLCNPTGFEDGTRFSRNGKDLNREFWKNSDEPEVQLLQAELISRSFQGIIALDTEDVDNGFYGYARGVALAKHILRQVPPIENEEGALSVPPNVKNRPFEIALKTPATQPSYINEMSFIGALLMILAEYREFVSYAPNL
jgi:protein MpaA